MFQRFGRMRASVLMVAVLMAFSASATALALGLGQDRALRPAGVTRYAWDASTTAVSTTSTSFVDMPSMSQTIVVPSGKNADIFVTFSGMMNTGGAGYVRVNVDGLIASPGEVQMVWDISGGAAAHAFTFFKTAGSGSHVVKMQWRGIGGDSVFVSYRSMLVTVNIY